MATTRKPATRRTKTPGSIKASRPAVRKEPRSLVELTSAEPDTEDEGIPVFSVDGTVYTMPSVISAGLALEVLDRLRTESEEQLIGWLLEEVLGTEAYQVLRSIPNLKPDQLAAIMDHVSEHVHGTLNSISGN